MKLNIDAFSIFPVLRTKRLTLRKVESTDAKQIFDIRSNDRVNSFIARESMPEISDANELINKIDDLYNEHSAIAWAGMLRGKEQIIGTCGLRNIEKDNLRAELGGELGVEYWGKELAVEAVTAIIDFGLNKMGLHTIEAKVFPGNRGAVFILERLGFKKEAHYIDRVHFDDEFYDLIVYTLHSKYLNDED